MTDPSGILDLIDSAVYDWETSEDAMRWSPNVPKPARRSGIVFGPPRFFIGDEEITVTAIEFDTVPGQPVGAEMIRAAAAFGQGLFVLSNYTATFTTALTDAAETVRQLARAFGLKPCRLGLDPCFCHPAPFPAARDYRRRTKHRNRRR